MRKEAEYFLDYMRKNNLTILNVLPEFVDSKKITLDIGGAVGSMTLFFSPLCQHVEVFEPVPVYYDKIEALKLPNVTVNAFAVSDENGHAMLNFEQGQGSIIPSEKGEKLGFIPTRTIDSFEFENVGFIKIDVEGAELKVLKGAINTISKQKPNLLIETIQRQLPFPLIELFQFLWDLGYKSLVYKDNKLQEITTPEQIKDYFETHLDEWRTYDTLFIPK